MSSLGEALRNAREARGLTLSDAAEHIHIRSVYLAAIEAEDWSAIGAPVYARGFVRAYARFLGLDPEEAVARFAERVPSESPSHVSASMASLGASPQRGAPSLVAIVGILVAVALVAFVGYEYYTYRAGTAAAPAAGSAGVPRAVDAAPSSSPEQVAAATPDAPAADGDPSPAADASPPRRDSASAWPSRPCAEPPAAAHSYQRSASSILRRASGPELRMKASTA